MFDFAIIADFLSPSSKDRIVYELSSPKKRIKALNRFSHNVETVVDPGCICFKGNTMQKPVRSEIEKSAAECMVLSFAYQQGKAMSIDEAFDYLSDESSAVLVLIENWLVIKPEYEGGEGCFYVLRKKQLCK